MKVSVIMTVKNGEKYLKEAIDSVQKQTHTNFELLIIDDGSTDNTLSILRELSERNPKIKYHETGGIGRSAALNLAIKETTAPLIANIDADDIWHPEKLCRQTRLFKQGFVGLVCTADQIIINNNYYNFPNLTSDTPIVTNISDKLLYTNPINHSSVMFLRNLIEYFGGYDENRPYLVDYELWCRLKKNGVKITKIESVLVGKRIHQAQSFENKNRLKYLLGDFTIRKELIRNTDSSFRFHLLNIAKFSYGLLPQRIRAFMKILITRK